MYLYTMQYTKMYDKPIFPGSLYGISQTPIHSPGDTNMGIYMERIKTKKGWKHKRPNYKKGVDFDFQLIPEQSCGNNRLNEIKAKEMLQNRSRYYRPYEKEVGYVSNRDHVIDKNKVYKEGFKLHGHDGSHMDNVNRAEELMKISENLGHRQEQVPIYGGANTIKVPILRNTTKFWNSVLVKPEDLLFTTFRSGKNRSRSQRSHKYLDKYLGHGQGRPWFRDKYQDKFTVSRKYNDKNIEYIRRDNMKSKMNKDPKFYDIGQHVYQRANNNVRRFTNYNQKTDNKNKQDIADTTGIKNTGNTKSLFSRSSIMSSKLQEHPNHNIEGLKQLPYDKYRASTKLMRGGPSTLDRVLFPSKDVLNRDSNNNIYRNIGTSNRIKYLPSALDDVVTPQSVLKARYAIRNTTRNAPLI